MKEETTFEELDKTDILNAVQKMIENYYTLKTMYTKYCDLSLPYREEDFPLCEPHQILDVKSEYEKTFHMIGLYNIKDWI